ncbi:DHS-like NAD/FAD-binding domain-containing protein [Polychytrium aggregatum]|uniref:DHS-like NAD/FAD-binding domain-containing protein n=1 Tax=Polychytrium aggregatum TaxID=110093 RepID=UPI0022FE8CFC|nr:DHS-like NAD/FAD-binding domain-containing protein [Polychytrium aggregatum]KAI9201957.1 DHS-like NAD/FAD-binding domain-containing protein [Polychytrium aggregatum]
MTLRFKLSDLPSEEAKVHLKSIAESLRRSKRCVVVTGAGISVSGGIPDFRSQNGLYNLVKEKYPTSIMKGRDLFDATLFRDPTSTALFFTFMGELKDVIAKASVTPTHQFLKSLDSQGKLLRCYTQNIDCLENRLNMTTDIDLEPKDLGLPKAKPDKGQPKVIQLHGDLDRVVCTVCGHTSKFTDEVQTIFKSGASMPCDQCVEQESIRMALGKRSAAVGMLRPNIVLYNEHHRNGDMIADFATYDLKRKPDLLIVMGTSLKVHGIKRLVKDIAKTVHELKQGKVIFINRTEVSGEWNGVFDYHLLDDTDIVVDMIEQEAKRLSDLAQVRSVSRKDRGKRLELSVDLPAHPVKLESSLSSLSTQSQDSPLPDLVSSDSESSERESTKDEAVASPGSVPALDVAAEEEAPAKKRTLDTDDAAPAPKRTRSAAAAAVAAAASTKTAVARTRASKRSAAMAQTKLSYKSTKSSSHVAVTDAAGASASESAPAPAKIPVIKLVFPAIKTAKAIKAEDTKLEIPQIPRKMIVVDAQPVA